MSGRHVVQYVAQCVACAALTLVVWQYITDLSQENVVEAPVSPLLRGEALAASKVRQSKVPPRESFLKTTY